jgi:hypothetical protein
MPRARRCRIASGFRTGKQPEPAVKVPGTIVFSYTFFLLSVKSFRGIGMAASKERASAKLQRQGQEAVPKTDILEQPPLLKWLWAHPKSFQAGLKQTQADAA